MGHKHQRKNRGKSHRRCGEESEAFTLDPFANAADAGVLTTRQEHLDDTRRENRDRRLALGDHVTRKSGYCPDNENLKGPAKRSSQRSRDNYQAMVTREAREQIMTGERVHHTVRVAKGQYSMVSEPAGVRIIGFNGNKRVSLYVPGMKDRGIPDPAGNRATRRALRRTLSKPSFTQQVAAELEAASSLVAGGWGDESDEEFVDNGSVESDLPLGSFKYGKVLLDAYPQTLPGLWLRGEEDLKEIQRRLDRIVLWRSEPTDLLDDLMVEYGGEKFVLKGQTYYVWALSMKKRNALQHALNGNGVPPHASRKVPAKNLSSERWGHCKACHKPWDRVKKACTNLECDRSKAKTGMRQTSGPRKQGTRGAAVALAVVASAVRTAQEEAGQRDAEVEKEIEAVELAADPPAEEPPAPKPPNGRPVGELHAGFPVRFTHLPRDLDTVYTCAPIQKRLIGPKFFKWLLNFLITLGVARHYSVDLFGASVSACLIHAAGGSRMRVLQTLMGDKAVKRILVTSVLYFFSLLFARWLTKFFYSEPHSVVYELVNTHDAVSDSDDRLEKFMHSNIRYENPKYATYRISDKYARPNVPESLRWILPKYWEKARATPLVVSSELVAQLSATVDLFSDEKASLLRVQRDMQRAAATTNVDRAFAARHSVFHSSARLISAYNFHLRDSSVSQHKGVHLN